MKSVFTLELENMARNLLGKYEDGCKRNFEYKVEYSKIPCGCKMASNIKYCPECKEIVYNCKKVLNRVSEEGEQ